MAEGKTPGNGSVSPFGNSKGATQAAGQSAGSHDFVSDPKSHATATGGRDFNKESRPQSEAKPEVVPNDQEIPAGGKVLKADPGPVSAKVAGTAEGVNCRKPFKGI